MLRQNSGDTRMEVRGVVQILDIGTVDTEQVVDTDGRKLVNDVVDHALLTVHTDNLSSPTVSMTREVRWFPSAIDALIK